MRSKQGRRAAGAAAMILFLLVLFAFLVLGRTDPNATVRRFTGPAFACGHSVNCTTPAAPDAPVFLDGEAATGPGGSEVLQSQTGSGHPSVFELQDNARLHFVPGTEANSVSQLVLELGRVFVEDSAEDRIPVLAGDIVIKPLGTRFLVWWTSGGIYVAVPANGGQVQISRRGAPLLMLVAGQEITVPFSGAAPPPAPIDPNEERAWQDVICGWWSTTTLTVAPEMKAAWKGCATPAAESPTLAASFVPGSPPQQPSTTPLLAMSPPTTVPLPAVPETGPPAAQPAAATPTPASAGPVVATSTHAARPPPTVTPVAHSFTSPTRTRTTLPPRTHVPPPTHTHVPPPTESLVPSPSQILVPSPTGSLISSPTRTRMPSPTRTLVPSPTESLIPSPTQTLVPSPTDTPVLPPPTCVATYSGTGGKCDSGTASSVLNVPDFGTILAVSAIDINIEVPGGSCVAATVRAPGGQLIDLFKSCGWKAPWSAHLVFTQARSDLQCNPPSSGVYRPVTPLGTLKGAPAHGDWVLHIDDVCARACAVVKSWSVHLITDAACGSPG